jgi:hypothetical protein
VLLISSAPIALLLGLWVGGHVLGVGIFLHKGQKYFVLLASFCLLTVYVIKPATFDLPRYSVYFETGIAPWLTSTPWREDGWVEEDFTREEVDHLFFQHFRNSPSFVRLMVISSRYLPHGSYLPRVVRERHVADSLVILIVVIGGLLFSWAIYLMRGYPKKTIEEPFPCFWLLPLMLGSVFFLLGSQNTLRFFLGLTCSLLAMVTLLRTSWKSRSLGIAAFFLAFTFHPWTVLFAVTGFVFVKLRSLVAIGPTGNRLAWIPNEYIIAFVLGLAALAVIKVGVIMDVGDFSTYSKIDWSTENFRTSSSTKLVAFFALVGITDLITGKISSDLIFDPASLRRCFLFFLTPLVIYPEIFSRISSFFLLADLIYLIWVSGKREKRARLSAVLIFGAYGIAPNALSIILDKGWKEILLYG